MKNSIPGAWAYCRDCYPPCHSRRGPQSGPREGNPTSSLEEILIQVLPPRILLLDQLDLPGPIPTLDLFFTADCIADVAPLFEPDQQVHAILLREAVDQIAPVLPCALREIARHADIKRPIRFAREEIDEIALQVGFPSLGPHALRAILAGNDIIV